jgi:shikimate dehydrogenase
MEHYGLIGYPISHSKSPAMQNAAFQERGLAAEYSLYETKPELFGERMAEFRKNNIAGFNVTTPFKEAVIPFLDEIDPMAERLQSVNTVVNRDGKWIGYSTDGAGFWNGLKEHAGHVIVMGTGAAARAIIAARPEGVALRVFARDSPNFAEKDDQVARLSGGILRPLGKIQASLPWADVVINATTVGMGTDESLLTREDLDLLAPFSKVFDIIYGARPTKLLELAKAMGYVTSNGLLMLVNQGALSFELWTKQTAPRDVMTQSVEQNEGNK